MFLSNVFDSSAKIMIFRLIDAYKAKKSIEKLFDGFFD